MYVYTREERFSETELVRIERDDTRQVGEHTHGFIEIVYILSGEGRHFIDGKEYAVSRGSVLFINYGQVHSFFTGTHMESMNILITPEAVSEKILNEENAFALLTLTAFEDFQEADIQTPFLHFSGQARDKIEFVIQELYAEFTQKQSGKTAILKGYLHVLLGYIFRKMTVSGLKQEPSEIIAYIQAHYKEKLTLQHLASKCFYTPKYFSRIFKEIYGVSVTEYIKRQRIAESCRLLLETDLSIEEIQNQVGYGEDVHFFKYFQAICGCTPSVYRKSRKI